MAAGAVAGGTASGAAVASAAGAAGAAGAAARDTARAAGPGQPPVPAEMTGQSPAASDPARRGAASARAAAGVRVSTTGASEAGWPAPASIPAVRLAPPHPRPSRRAAGHSRRRPGPRAFTGAARLAARRRCRRQGTFCASRCVHAGDHPDSVSPALAAPERVDLAQEGGLLLRGRLGFHRAPTDRPARASRARSCASWGRSHLRRRLLATLGTPSAASGRLLFGASAAAPSPSAPPETAARWCPLVALRGDRFLRRRVGLLLVGLLGGLKASEGSPVGIGESQRRLVFRACLSIPRGGAVLGPPLLVAHPAASRPSADRPPFQRAVGMVAQSHCRC